MARAKAAKAAPAPAAQDTTPAAPAGFVSLRHVQIVPDPLNPRKDFDETGIAELAESIARDGLMQNLVVRPGETDHGGDVTSSVPLHRLVAGERRWRAIRALIRDGRWPEDRPIPCQVVEISDEEHAARALVENLQRRDLKPLEEADALNRLMAATGLGTREVAERIGFTQRFVQQRLQLLELGDKDKARLEKGEITIEDARRRLANRPKLREDITPAGWLILLELVDYASRTGEGPCDSVEVGPEIREDEAWQALRDCPGWLVSGPSPQWDAGFETGRYTASVSSYGGHPQLELKFPQAFKSDDGMQRALAEARGAAGVEFPLGFEPGGYATAWLNGPWEVAPEVQAQIEQAKADRARQDQERAEREREAAAKIGEAFNVAQSILLQHRKRELPALDGRIAEAWAALGFVLPFTVDAGGSILDARGRTFQHGYHHNAVPPAYLAQRRLTAVALNAAAGLHTPEPAAAEDDEPPSREDFVRMVAGCLADDLEISDAIAAAMAEKGLAAYLSDNRVEYGHCDCAWDFDVAMEIAELIRVEGLGQQIDLEEAIAAAPPADELSPALQALATGHSQPIAEAAE